MISKVKNVAVFPCGTEIGLEIGRQLSHTKNLNLIGINSAEDFSQILYRNLITGAPDVYSADLEDYLIKLVDELKIHVLIPAHDEAIFRLAQFQKLKLKTHVIAPRPELAETLRSKSKTYNALRGSIALPRIFENRGEAYNGGPVFMKPDVGQGSVGAAKAANLSAAFDQIERDDRHGMLVLEYLPGDEFTIDCFSDKKSNPVFINARRRARISKGISVRSINANSEQFEKIARNISERLSLVGPWFFQAKQNDDKEFVLLEVANRIAGSSSHSRALGFNFMEAALFQLDGLPIAAIKNNYSLVSERALSTDYIVDLKFDEVFVDFDDTVLKENGIFGALIGFLFEAKYRGKKIHLITRHAGDLEAALRTCFLNSFFDSVIHLKQKEAKSDFIPPGSKAIFIDDSFRERLDVWKHRQIPVFSLDMIDVLTSSIRKSIAIQLA